MLGNMFLMFVAVGIGLGAAAYGFGGVFLVVCGISFAALAWGATVSIVSRGREAPVFVARDRGVASRLL